MREIEDEISTSLEKQGLQRVYKGPQAYMNPNERFWLTFKTHEFHFETTQEAKSFFVKKIHSLLALYNSNPKLRPFLEHYPVKASELWVTIIFYRTPKEIALAPEFCRIELKKGTIYYYRWDTETKSPQEVYQEPFKIKHEG